MTAEFFRDLQFVERPQNAEIADAGQDIFFDIGGKIALKFVGFGILMIDFAADNIALICARFVRENDVLTAGQIRTVERQKRDDRRERRMAVQKTLSVQRKKRRCNGAVRPDDVVFGVAGRPHGAPFHNAETPDAPSLPDGYSDRGNIS